MKDEASVSNPVSWPSLKEMFAEVVTLDPPARKRFLDETTADTFTRDELLRLIGYHEDAGAFFEQLSADIRPLLVQEPLIEPGTILAERFLIEKFLARGGMGEVYAAQDLELGGICALKIMKPGLNPRPGSLARFREEIRLSRDISSDHVCRIYDVDRHTDADRELVFFTMEFLDGETLSEKILRGPLTVEEIRTIVPQMAEGLDAAHRKGVLHRDFKSGNVMLCDGARRVVITDFGLSRRIATDLVEEGPNADAALLDGATPAYAAPEQFLQGPETERADIYAFGVVIYEAATGRLPYAGEDAKDIIDRKLNELPIPPGKLRSGLPKAWDTVIMRCLNRDPEKRFANAAEVSQALGCAAKKAEHLSRRLWLGLAACGSAAGAGGWWAWQRERLPEAPSAAVLPFEFETAELRYLAEGMGDRLTDTLTQLPGIRIVSRTASQRVKDSAQDLAETGRKLRVRYVITGSVKKSGSRLHVTNEVVEASTAIQIWAGTEDLAPNEVERLNLTLSQAVVQSLKIDAQPARLSEIARSLTASGQAYENYLLGKYYAARRSREALTESVKNYKMAVAQDPAFAVAWASLAYVSYDLAFRDPNSRPLVGEAVDAARRALQLDPKVSEAYLAMGCVKRTFEWDFRGAEQNFRRALDLNPGSALAHRWYADLMTRLGRLPEALSHIEQAVSLDPLSSDLQVTRATVLMYSDRVDDAIAAYQSVVHSDPGYENVYAPMSDALELKGLRQDAIAACEKAVALTHRASYALSELGRFYGLAGRTAEATSILDELQNRYKTGNANATDVAYVFLGVGNRDKAFEWLEQGMLRRDRNLLLLKVGLPYRILQGDSRYWSLMRRVGFEN